MKNNILTCINPELPTESYANTIRVKRLNDFKVGDGELIYLINREFRAKDNFALLFSQNFAGEFSLRLKVLLLKNTNSVKAKGDFIDTQKAFLKRDLGILNIDFEEVTNFEKYVETNKISALVFDFNPIFQLNISKFNFPVFVVDGHNIVPAWFLSDKKEYNSATFRRKMYSKIWDCMTEFPKTTLPDNEADLVLAEFLNKKIEKYSKNKNNPTKDATSNLSKYLNSGFISPQRVALEVYKSGVDDLEKETFLEELIIRGELSDNFCLYANNYKSYDDVADWAKETIFKHKDDVREYLYDVADFEDSKTHDKLWNASQNQLKTQGKIHGYLRMYWAKKIFEWSETPEKALETAIFLNDKYGFDAPSSNGYVGILWSLAGLHDRAFKERRVTGKIRTMTYNGAKSKFDIQKYIEQFN